VDFPVVTRRIFAEIRPCASDRRRYLSPRGMPVPGDARGVMPDCGAWRTGCNFVVEMQGRLRVR
jgi:hypothetical protein